MKGNVRKACLPRNAYAYEDIQVILRKMADSGIAPKGGTEPRTRSQRGKELWQQITP